MPYPLRSVQIGFSVVALASMIACAPMNTTPVSNYPTSSAPANSPGSIVEFGRVSNVEIIRSQEPARGPGIGATGLSQCHLILRCAVT